MRWIRRLFGRGAPRDLEPEKGAQADVRPAPRVDDGPGREEPAEGTEEDGELARPVDLTANLDVGLESVSTVLRESLAEGVKAMALRAERGAERPFLAELAGRLRAGDLRLPPMPQAVVRVQRLLDSPSCNVGDLAREIEVDPALTTRLVGIANSPFYQVLGPVQSLSDAVVRIGLGETRNIVFAVTLRSRVFRVPGREAEVQGLWAHSVAASLSAQALGACVGEDPDSAFLVGLLHDLGRVVLLAMAGEIERAGKGRARIGPEQMQRLDAVLHAPLGALAAESWRIDPALCRAIARHHARDDVDPMVRIARCADLMAHRIEEGPPDPQGSEDDVSEAFTALGLDAESALEIQADVREALRTRGKHL